MSQASREHTRELARTNYIRRKVTQGEHRKILKMFMRPVDAALQAMDEIARLDHGREQGVNCVIRKGSERT